jgi:hypothetical protein
MAGMLQGVCCSAPWERFAPARRGGSSCCCCGGEGVLAAGISGHHGRKWWASCCSPRSRGGALLLGVHGAGRWRSAGGGRRTSSTEALDALVVGRAGKNMGRRHGRNLSSLPWGKASARRGRRSALLQGRRAQGVEGRPWERGQRPRRSSAAWGLGARLPACCCVGGMGSCCMREEDTEEEWLWRLGKIEGWECKNASTC